MQEHQPASPVLVDQTIPAVAVNTNKDDDDDDDTPILTAEPTPVPARNHHLQRQAAGAKPRRKRASPKPAPVTPPFCATNTKWWPAHCPDDSPFMRAWLQERRKIIDKYRSTPSAEIPPHYRDLDKWLLMDVGANKGYTLARWMESLVGTSRIPRYDSLSVTYRAMKFAGLSTVNRAVCGGCSDCDEDALEFASQEEFDRISPVGKELLRFGKEKEKSSSSNNNNNVPPIRMVAVEPLLANYKFLTQFLNVAPHQPKWMQNYTDSTGRSRSIFDINFAAVGNAEQNGKTAVFPTGPFGNTMTSFNTKNGRQGITTTTINIKSIDQIVLTDPAYKDSYIDYLMTDVEGFDMDAQDGAVELLQSNRVKMYLFEMHQRVNYTTIFKKLASWNYECYYETESRSFATHSLPMVVKITSPDCIDVPILGQFVGWYNAVCINTISAPELVEIFNHFETVFTPKGQFFKDESIYGRVAKRMLKRKWY